MYQLYIYIEQQWGLSVWVVLERFFQSLSVPYAAYILKQTWWCMCVYKNWAVPGRFFQSLPVPCGAGDKQARAWRPRQLPCGVA